MRVEVFVDVICPWCYIGARRLEQALEQFDHGDEVEVVWRSFELDPSAPPSDESVTTVEHLAASKRMSAEQVLEMVERVEAVARGEGLECNLEEAHPGNTFDAHRLLHLALDRGLQGALKARLDRASFVEGVPVSDHEALASLAVEVGLDEAEVREVLAGDRYAEAVRADERWAHQQGISGVPFFVVDGRYGVSGAQPPAALVGVLERAWSERTGAAAT